VVREEPVVSKKFWAVALLALSLLVVSCDLDTSRTVRFYASSTSSLTTVIYYNSADGVHNNVVSPASPWSIETEGEQGDFVILTVGGVPGDLTARIYIDGTLFKEKTGTTIIQVYGYVE
jgi:hypothetical protein